ncbi:MAG: hypothetical protein ACE5LD_03060 [Candidatus Bipolaricaulia bacterium]
MKYILVMALVGTGFAGAAEAAGMNFAAGAGLGILELHGLKGAWGLTEDVARLLQGVAELGPRAGLGARLSGEWGLLEGQGLSKFDLAIHLNVPLRGAAAYFGGGSGILGFGGHIYPLVHLVGGLKAEVFHILTVFIEAKLIGVLELSGRPSLFPGMPLEFSPGAMFYF